MKPQNLIVFHLLQANSLALRSPARIRQVVPASCGFRLAAREKGALLKPDYIFDTLALFVVPSATGGVPKGLRSIPYDNSPQLRFPPVWTGRGARSRIAFL